MPVLLNLGIMFGPPCVLRAILNTLALFGAGVSVIALFRIDYQGSLKGHYDHSLLFGYMCLVVSRCGQAPQSYKSRGPPSFTVEGMLFQGDDVVNH